MQNLDADLRDAFDKCLMGNYKERVVGMAKYFAKDARFTHPIFKTYTRDDAWGIYELWAANRFSLGTEYLEIFCDDKHNSVLLDVLQHPIVWWWLIRPHVEIHTILDLEDGPHGKVIMHQFDYPLFVESILYFTFPWLGEIAKKYVLPANGAALAYLGRKMYRGHGAEGLPAPLYAPLIDLDSAIPRAVEVLFVCSPAQRHALVHHIFSKDCLYYHSFLTVEGPEQIFGVANFWAVFNRRVDIKIVRFVPSGSRIMVDSVHTFTPRFWPPAFLLHPPVWYHHILLETTNNPAGGKLIKKVQNYLDIVDPFFQHCLGPLSAVYEALRDFNGQVFAKAGRAIHALLEWWDSKKAAVHDGAYKLGK